jgi:hypothetical protein|nr:MAG TPA: hypothetical protein [Caudoviricetes sp.]
MKSIYACLCGTWVNLSASNATVDDGKPVNTWWKNEGDKLFEYDYLNIQYNGKNYRIHPSFIQVVTG